MPSNAQKNVEKQQSALQDIETSISQFEERRKEYELEIAVLQREIADLTAERDSVAFVCLFFFTLCMGSFQ